MTLYRSVGMYFYHLFVIARKDFLLEIRSKDVILPVFMFSFLVVVTFNFALEATPNTVNLVGFNRVFLSELELGAFQGLLTSPIGRDVIFLGKVLSNLMFLVVIEAILVPVLIILFNITLSPLDMICVSLPALLGLSLSGTLFAAISMNMRAKEVMLPILFLPAVVPIILGSVESTYLIMTEASLHESLKWIILMIIFDVVYCVVGAVGFTMIIED